MANPKNDLSDAELLVLAERYHSLLEAGPVGVFEVHRDGTVRFANNAVARSAGYPNGPAMIGTSILRHYADPEQRDALYRELAATGSVTNGPITVLTLDGNVRHLLLSALAFDDVTRGLSVDVTAEYEKERELKNALELNRSIFEAMPGGIVHVRADGSIQYANGDACRILGFSFDQLTQRYTRDFETETIHEDGTTCSLEHYPVTRALITGQTQPPHTIGVRRPDGGVSWAVFRAVPVRDGADGKVSGAVVTFFDITDRKAGEQTLHALEERVRHAQKLESLGLLAGGVAHDFNNLLAAILGNVSLAKIQLPPESPAVLSVAAVEAAAQRAAELTRQMLTYAGRGQVEAQQIDISELVRELTELLGTVISKKASIELALAPELPLTLADPAQLSQVVMNLILNASEALEDRPGTIRIQTGVKSLDSDALRQTYVDDDLPAGRYVFLEVSDDGAGMDTSTRLRVFDPFFTTKTTGRGLGLAATLGIIRSHKGAVELSSELQRGTTFRVWLPVSTRPRAETSEKRSEEPPQHGHGTVLVIDDEPAVREVTRRLLEELGYSVITADGGKHGIETFRAHAGEIQVVLLDLTMTDMHGTEVMDELVRLEPRVRVVLTSGYAENDVAERFERRNLAGFLQKPYSASALVDALLNARKR